MKKNMHPGDRITRLVIAGILTTIYFSFHFDFMGIKGTILLALSAALALTGLIGYCPLYILFGVSTSSTEER